MKKHNLVIILSLAVPALGVSQIVENLEPIPAEIEEAPAVEQRDPPADAAPPANDPGESIVDRAKNAASSAAERASEALDRAKAKSAGKGKSDPGSRQPPVASEAVVPQSDPPSERRMPENAERGKGIKGRTPSPVDPGAVVPPSVEKMREGKAVRGEGKAKAVVPPAPKNVPVTSRTQRAESKAGPPREDGATRRGRCSRSRSRSRDRAGPSFSRSSPLG